MPGTPGGVEHATPFPLRRRISLKSIRRKETEQDAHVTLREGATGTRADKKEDGSILPGNLSLDPIPCTPASNTGYKGRLTPFEVTPNSLTPEVDAYIQPLSIKPSKFVYPDPVKNPLASPAVQVLPPRYDDLWPCALSATDTYKCHPDGNNNQDTKRDFEEQEVAVMINETLLDMDEDEIYTERDAKEKKEKEKIKTPPNASSGLRGLSDPSSAASSPSHGPRRLLYAVLAVATVTCLTVISIGVPLYIHYTSVRDGDAAGDADGSDISHLILGTDQLGHDLANHMSQDTSDKQSNYRPSPRLAAMFPKSSSPGSARGPDSSFRSQNAAAAGRGKGVPVQLDKNFLKRIQAIKQAKNPLPTSPAQQGAARKTAK